MFLLIKIDIKETCLDDPHFPPPGPPSYRYDPIINEQPLIFPTREMAGRFRNLSNRPESYKIVEVKNVKNFLVKKDGFGRVSPFIEEG